MHTTSKRNGRRVHGVEATVESLAGAYGGSFEVAQRAVDMKRIRERESYLYPLNDDQSGTELMERDLNWLLPKAHFESFW
jgi:hypothetical protein